MSERRPGRGSFFLSVLVHLGAVAVIVVTSAETAPRLPPMRLYRVSIVSPPPQAAGEPAPAVVATKTPPKPKEAKKPAPPKPRPKPVPAKRAPRRARKSRPATPKTTVVKTTVKSAVSHRSRGAEPDARSRGGRNLNVDIKGEEFPYPGYLENIIEQVRRYFRWTGAPGLRTQVYFVIHRDGSVTGIRVLNSSGNRIFDFQALGAVEVAGKRGAFGSLPKGFQGDALPVEFFIDAR